MRKYLIICLIILISNFNVGCIDYNDKTDNNEKKENWQCYYWYHIEINSSSHYYDLNIPIPVYVDENRTIHISPIIEDLKVVQGNALFEIENTSHGPSLRINGTGYVVINVSGNDLSKYLIHKIISIIFLSMARDENNDGYYDDEYDENEYFIFYSQNSTIYIKIILDYFHYSKEIPGISGFNSIEGNLKQGWNNVTGWFNVVV